MNTKSNYYVFYDSTWLQIAITAFGKIFCREEMLVDLSVFPEIHQIKLMIRQTKFLRKSTFVTRKIKSCQKKELSSTAKL